MDHTYAPPNGPSNWTPLKLAEMFEELAQNIEGSELSKSATALKVLENVSCIWWLVFIDTVFGHTYSMTLVKALILWFIGSSPDARR